MSTPTAPGSRAIMLQGTGSDVGKSIIVAGLCRVARRRGISVAPFKPQNMSNNAAACPEGGEIGRAQALQARASGLEPHILFNPVLLKPQSDFSAQVLVHGKPLGIMEAAEYFGGQQNLLPAVLESFKALSQKHDLIVIEGAGSPAEINLRHRDIANMGFARAAGVPVCLIGDIDKGGVIASLVGTQYVLCPEDAAMITSFIVNKFRGDPALFIDGVREIEMRTHWPCIGVIPWLNAVACLPAEDAVSLSCPVRPKRGALKVAAPMLSRLANFDDADPLRLDPAVDFTWVQPGQAVPRDTDVIILFGTKSTIADLDFLKSEGWDHDIMTHVRQGGCVLGLCGGYQMLGRVLHDPDGVDGPAGTREGLGLLDIETTMLAQKIVRKVDGQCALSQTPLKGYEIHAGLTQGPDCAKPLLLLANGFDGARSPSGRVEGSYVHGLFSSDPYRAAWLARMGAKEQSLFAYEAEVDNALDGVADGLEAALDIDMLLTSARAPGWSA